MASRVLGTRLLHNVPAVRLGGTGLYAHDVSDLVAAPAGFVYVVQQEFQLAWAHQRLQLLQQLGGAVQVRLVGHGRQHKRIAVHARAKQGLQGIMVVRPAHAQVQQSMGTRMQGPVRGLHIHVGA